MRLECGDCESAGKSSGCGAVLTGPTRGGVVLVAWQGSCAQAKSRLPRSPGVGRQEVLGPGPSPGAPGAFLMSWSRDPDFLHLVCSLSLSPSHGSTLGLWGLLGDCLCRKLRWAVPRGRGDCPEGRPWAGLCSASSRCSLVTSAVMCKVGVTFSI